MRSRTLAERAAFVSAAIGIAIGVFFLFGPSMSYCQQSVSATIPPGGVTPSVPLGTPGPTICGTEALWQAQPIWPMPFLVVLLWSLAPTVSYVGVRLRVARRRDAGAALMALGVVIALSSIISFGAAPLFIPFVFVPTLITTLVAWTRT